jgi:GNAT superfamily N-acetyltransferase
MRPADTYRIRLARLPDDKPALLGFIVGMQHFESAIENDRRTDPDVAEEFYVVITDRIAQKNGRILIAESDNGRALGWAAACEEESEVYIHADERTYGYVAELYVVEDMRGRGIGRALIAACEEWARERRLKAMMIGLLSRNARAHGVYRGAGFQDYVTMLRKYLQ